MGGTAVGSSGSCSDTHSCPTQEHTLRHTPPARPPGPDDPLNSSNYQALTDRQIRSEQGAEACPDRQTEGKVRQTDTGRKNKQHGRQKERDVMKCWMTVTMPR